MLILSHWRAAMRICREVVRLDPASATARSNLGLSLEEAGREEPAEAEYRAAIQGRPQAEAGHFHLVNLLRKRGRLEEAISEYQAALAINPDSLGAQLNLGLSFEARGAKQWAIVHYRKAVHLQPDSAKAHCWLGTVGMVPEAIKELRQAVRLAPHDAVQHGLLGLTLIGDGCCLDGFGELGRAILLRPWNPCSGRLSVSACCWHS